MNIDKESVCDIIELTSLQSGLLYHYLENNGSEVYKEKVCIELKGEICNESFVQAWQQVAKSHPALRTMFVWEKIKHPVQVILKEKKLNIAILPLADKESFEKNIDIRTDPFYIVLLEGAVEHAMWLIYSHILLDGWSLAILLRDFNLCYNALIKHQPFLLETKPSMQEYVQYLKNASSLETLIDYWKKQLEGCQREPYLYPNHSGTGGYKSFSLKLESDFLEKLGEMGHKRCISPAVILYSAWAILLHLYRRVQDVVFGVTVSHRNMNIKQIQDIAGLLINTIPLRVQFSKGLLIETLLKEMLEQSIASQEHSLLSLTEIVQTTGGQLKTGLFDTLLVVENYPSYDLLSDRERALIISRYSSQELTHYPLTLIFDLSRQKEVSISFNAGLFSKSYIEQILTHFFRIIVAMTNAQMVEEISLLSKEESRKLAIALNPRTMSTDRPTMAQVFNTIKEAYPQKCAVVKKGNVLSYRELDERSEIIANALRERGVSREDRIGVQMHKSLEQIVALLAIVKLEAAYISINPSLPKERVDYIIQDSGVCFIIDEQLTIHSCATTIEKPQTVSPLLYILYTSGSTGKPKGVLIEQKGVLRLVKDKNSLAFSLKDVLLSTCSLDFDVSAWEIWGCLLNGATLCLVDEVTLLSLDIMKKEILSNHVTMAWLTTPLFNIWVKEDISLFGTFNKVVVGGDVLSPMHIRELKTKYPDIYLFNGYGPTENSIISTFHKIDEKYDHRVPIGKPVSNSSAYIVDFFGRLQPIGAVGEIWLGGEGVARGYLNLPSLTHEKFRDNPFGDGRVYVSGDLGRWLEDGSIDFLGRDDFCVKVRGYRIEICEVEWAIKSCPFVVEAAIIIDEKEEKALIAFIQKEEGFDLAKLKIDLASKLPAYAIPSKYVLIESFPLGVNGKINRQELVNQKGIEPPIEIPLPLSAFEKKLTELYERVLGNHPLYKNQNFFDAGGNSLRAIQLRSAIQKTFNRDIPITDIFQFPTIAQMASHLQIETKIEQKSVPQEITRDGDIAVIGLSGRFPKAASISQFWENLHNGREGISLFSRDELIEEGIDPDLIDHPDYVRAKGFLDGIEYFDHAFFSYTPREAEILDPQLRLLHEECWHVLEDGGYAAEDFDEKIGLFIGSEVNVAWVQQLVGHFKDPTQLWNAAHYTVHSVAATIAYKLNFKGPCLTIDTACSSSLVAIHQAKCALRNRECAMAIAGGVSLELPKKGGYLYQEGMIRSKDGKCSPFDAQASGTVSGDGVGLVLLKPLQKAIEDRDHIYAVLKGSAINNDGNRKVGYTSPSVAGQNEVIVDAFLDAKSSFNDISYIEAHGTATQLGDAVEIKALSESYVEVSHPIGIGSVKSSIGHLNTASGVAGFIKAVLSIHHQYIPPSLHFKTENPHCPFYKTPFYVVDKGKTWIEEKRGAAVSSFGIGGTNAHAVLCSPPHILKNKIGKMEDKSYLVILSAKSKQSLIKSAIQMAPIFDDPNLDIGAACYTLQVGRAQCRYRLAVQGENGSEISQSLLKRGEGIKTPQELPKVVFIFPSSKEAMYGKRYYKAHNGIQNWIDYGRVIADKYGVHEFEKDGVITSPVGHFIWGYAWACYLQELGIRPAIMIGDSDGEFILAALSDVLTFEAVIEFLCKIALLQTSLKNDTNSFHAIVKDLPLSKPEFSYISCLTGEWVKAEDVTSPSYWMRLLSGSTVFSQGLAFAIKEKGEILIKVGSPYSPTFDGEENQLELGSCHVTLTRLLSRLWLRGIDIAWKKLYQEPEQRLPLPGYVFDPYRFWKYGSSAQQWATSKLEPISHLYQTIWEKKTLPRSTYQEHVFYIFNESLSWDKRLLSALRNHGEVHHLSSEMPPKKMSHCLYLLDCSEDTAEMSTDAFKKAFFSPFNRLLSLLQQLGQETSLFLHLIVKSELACDMSESAYPIAATFAAFFRSIRSEYPLITAQVIDIDDTFEIDALIALVTAKGDEFSEVLLREGNRIYTRQFSPVIAKEKWDQDLPFKKGGVYLITGGSGGIGSVISSFLVEQFQAKVILASRSGLHYRVDVADQTALTSLVGDIYHDYGHLDGVIHLAGVPDEGMIQTKTLAAIEEVFRPKVYGTLNLIQALSDYPKPDFILLGGSMASIRGDFGQAAYVMANAYMNAIAKRYHELGWPILSLNWDTWAQVGMARNFQNIVHTTQVKEIVIALRADTDWVLNEHRIQDIPVLPGVAYLSFLMKQVVALALPLPICIAEMTFLRPLSVTEKAELLLSLEQSEGGYHFTFAAEGEEVCKGRITLNKKQIAKRTKRLGKMREKKQLSKIGNTLMHFGPRWRNAKQIYYSNQAGEAMICLNDAFIEDLKSFSLHPAMIDTATSFLLDALHPASNLLPYAYQNLTIYQPHGKEITSQMRLLKNSPLDSTMTHFSFEIFNDQNDPCMEGEVIFKKVDETMALQHNRALIIEKKGNIDSLYYRQIETPIIDAESVEIETIATGVNFKEVLYSLGLIPSTSPGSTISFGLEVAGVVSRIGRDVKRFKVGDPVMGLVSGGFNRYLSVKESEIILKPERVSYEEAAAIPVAFLTAYYALIKKGRLEKGKKVLIHSATGGVGLAALEIARSLGAEIYATAGSPEKRSFLKNLGVSYVFDSRSTDFADTILDVTGGYGVDIVLNSLTGEALKRSLEIVAPEGTFIEIGIKDIIDDTALGMRLFQKGISLISFSLSSKLPGYLEALEEIVKAVAESRWKVPPLTLFSRDQTKEAFAFLASAKHIGKVVVVHHKKQVTQHPYALSNEEGIQTIISAAQLASADQIAVVYATKQTPTLSPAQNISKSITTNLKPRPILSSVYDPPVGDIEKNLAFILEGYLSIEGIGIQDSFAELGMSSIDMIQFKSLIAKSLSVEISIAQLYITPTIASLADWINTGILCSRK